MRLGLSLVVVDRILKRLPASSTQLDTIRKLDRMVPTEENIDAIEWVPDPAEFIYNAIAPAEVDQVILTMKIANMLSLRFQIINYLLPLVVVVKTFVLAAHLTGYRIDIKSASEFEEMEAAQETFEDQVESGEEQVD